MLKELDATEARELVESIRAQAELVAEKVREADTAVKAAIAASHALQAACEEYDEAIVPVRAYLVSDVGRLVGALLDNFEGRAFSGIELAVALDDAEDIVDVARLATDKALRKLDEASK